jgi:hypothetical protein
MTRFLSNARRSLAIAVVAAVSIWGLAALPARADEPPNPEHGPAALMSDVCGDLLLVSVLPAFVLNTAHLPIPVPLPSISIGQVTGPACTFFGYPYVKTVCPGDGQFPALVPPPEGRALDVIDSAELMAADAGAPFLGVADVLRTQLHCEVVPFS